ncbi:uncharacterized protein B0H64DRAFT_401076 [Chaetomium fimeti]|uniref:Uncharacterized protein n=1 Tax=Chaetomium fimeti TaxID=1854472 RepID=A0AAE0HDM6_9PEZI|nr:hypothetical protein B0H64DRAFT_401076 [Chaetomium fimeti]
MATYTNIETLARIPTTWTAPASCFASTNLYRVVFPSGTGAYFMHLFATPTPFKTDLWPASDLLPKGDCWPPSTTLNVPYLTDGGCPAGYTRACATGIPDISGKPASLVTCCPSVTNNAYSFMCQNNEYGCHGTATPGAVWTGVLTHLAQSVEEPITFTPDQHNGYEAWGIKLLSVATGLPTSTHTTPTNPGSTTNPDNPANPKSTTTPPPNTQTNLPATATSNTPANQTPPPTARNGSSSSSSASGLPTAAIVGLALGSVGAVVLLAIAAILFRQHRRRKARGSGISSSSAGITSPARSDTTSLLPPPPTGLKDLHQLDGGSRPQMLEAPDPRPGARLAWEMAG